MQPYCFPSSQPSRQPTEQPSCRPTSQPSQQPSNSPSNQPVSFPTSQPSSVPSFAMQIAIEFDVSASFDGISDLSLAENTEENKNLFITVLKSIIPRGYSVKAINVSAVKSNRVLTSWVTDYEKVRNTLASGLNKARLHLLANVSYSLKVDYTISIELQRAGFSAGTNSIAAYAAASSTILHIFESSSNSNNTSSFLSSLQAMGVKDNLKVLETPTLGSFTQIILHSAYPTSVPTSMPSCGAGSEGWHTDCEECKPGYFSSRDPKTQVKISCNPCPLDTYSTRYGSKECSKCSYPFTTYTTGSVSCSSYSIYTPIYIEGFPYDLNNFLTIFVVLFVFTISLLFAKDQKMHFFLIMILPLCDFVSDVLYVQTAIFYNKNLAYSCMVALYFQNCVFVYELYKEGRMPRFFLEAKVNTMLPSFYFNKWYSKKKYPPGPPTQRESRICCIDGNNDEWYPVYIGVTIGYYSQYNDSIPKTLITFLSWTFLFALYCTTIVLYVVYVAVHVIFWCFWLLVAFLIFPLKIFAIKRVRRGWLTVWNPKNSETFERQGNMEPNPISLAVAATNISALSSGARIADYDNISSTGKGDEEDEVDIEYINQSILSEFIFETLPQLVLQVLNNTITHIWTPQAYFSSIFSIFMTLNGLHKFLYWLVVRGKPMKEVPQDLDLSIFGYTIVKYKFNAKQKAFEKPEPKANETNANINAEMSFTEDEFLIIQTYLHVCANSLNRLARKKTTQNRGSIKNLRDELDDYFDDEHCVNIESVLALVKNDYKCRFFFQSLDGIVNKNDLLSLKLALRVMHLFPEDAIHSNSIKRLILDKKGNSSPGTRDFMAQESISNAPFTTKMQVYGDLEEGICIEEENGSGRVQAAGKNRGGIVNSIKIDSESSQCNTDLYGNSKTEIAPHLRSPLTLMVPTSSAFDGIFDSQLASEVDADLSANSVKNAGSISTGRKVDRTIGLFYSPLDRLDHVNIDINYVEDATDICGTIYLDRMLLAKEDALEELLEDDVDKESNDISHMKASFIFPEPMPDVSPDVSPGFGVERVNDD